MTTSADFSSVPDVAELRQIAAFLDTCTISDGDTIRAAADVIERLTDERAMRAKIAAGDAPDREEGVPTTTGYPTSPAAAERAVLEAAIEWVRADMETSTYLERCQAHFELRHTVRALHAAGGGVSNG